MHIDAKVLRVEASGACGFTEGFTEGLGLRERRSASAFPSCGVPLFVCCDTGCICSISVGAGDGDTVEVIMGGRAEVVRPPWSTVFRSCYYLYR